MSTPLSITMPYSMRPWFSTRIAIALTALTPVPPAVLARALAMNGVTPDTVRVAYTKRSIMNPHLKTIGYVHLTYDHRDYYFAYIMEKSGQFTVPKYTPAVEVNRIIRAKELTAWLPVHVRPASFLERLIRSFAFREK